MTSRQLDKKIQKKIDKALKKIVYVPTDEKLTFAGGLPAFMELFSATGLEEEFLQCLPERNHARSIGSLKLGYTVMFSFLFGFECLSDIEKFRKDPTLREMFQDEAAAARTIGDFLRDFTPEHIECFNLFLEKMCRFIWQDLQGKLSAEFIPNKFILDVDSTIHEQHGDKMEGLAFNFKGEWGLDSQQAYDQLGLCHGYQLRPGNTKSGIDAMALIENTFSNNTKTQQKRRNDFYDFFRADSAYCTEEIIKGLLKRGLHFTITAHDGWTGWKKAMKESGLQWQPWVYSQKELEIAENKGKELPRVEITRILWSPEWSKKEESKLVFPIVIKRTWSEKKEKKRKRQEREQGLFMEGFYEEEPWEYYGVLTNVPLNTERSTVELSSNQRYWGIQEVFEFHKKRGNAENFIREEKYNFRLKNYPCQKLLANHAYGQLCQVAHNLLRWVALLLEPGKPHYSKKLRNNLLLIPGRIIESARYTVMKVPRWAYKEVCLMREACRLKPEKVPAYYSTA